jgi:uncharacterized MAPEG superfamily protein
MKPELSLLLWSVALAFVQVLVAVQGAMMQLGLPALAANREALPELKGWAGRAQRAQRNMVENLLLFVPLVLVAVVADKTNAITLLGAQIFFWARLAYAGVYVAGITWLRTGVWFVSVIGLILIFAQLI